MLIRWRSDLTAELQLIQNDAAAAAAVFRARSAQSGALNPATQKRHFLTRADFCSPHMKRNTLTHECKYSDDQTKHESGSSGWKRKARGGETGTTGSECRETSDAFGTHRKTSAPLQTRGRLRATFTIKTGVCPVLCERVVTRYATINVLNSNTVQCCHITSEFCEEKSLLR